MGENKDSSLFNCVAGGYSSTISSYSEIENGKANRTEDVKGGYNSNASCVDSTKYIGGGGYCSSAFSNEHDRYAGKMTTGGREYSVYVDESYNLKDGKPFAFYAFVDGKKTKVHKSIDGSYCISNPIAVDDNYSSTASGYSGRPEECLWGLVNCSAYAKLPERILVDNRIFSKEAAYGEIKNNYSIGYRSYYPIPIGIGGILFVVHHKVMEECIRRAEETLAQMDFKNA